MEYGNYRIKGIWMIATHFFGGEPFGRAAPELCAGGRRGGGYGLSFRAVPCRHAPQSRKDGGVKFAENGRKTHRKRGMGKPRNCPESRTAPAGTPSAAGE